MQTKAFRMWLRTAKGYDESTCRSRTSNCERIEAFEGDLDAMYEDGHMGALLQRLTYSKNEYASHVSPKHAIPINGNEYTGTATLKTAANLYLAFREGDAVPKRAGSSFPAQRFQPQKAPGLIVGKRVSSPWPLWEQPSEEDVMILARVMTKHVKFLSPSIIDAITEDNNRNRDEWSELLFERDIDPLLYLWEGSSCAFPGVRRHAGAKEIAQFRAKDFSSIDAAAILDDNSYPKQIWSHVLCNHKFAASGPAGFKLAHLIDHKDYKNRMTAELSIHPETSENTLFGLFTCPSNTAYVPDGLIHPTDFNAHVRNLIQRKAAQLYDGYCMLLPKGMSVLPACESIWDLANFTWDACVGTLENVECFLEFRKKTVDALLNPAHKP